MEIAFDPRFIPSVNVLDPVDVRRVWKAVEKFQRDQESRGLNFERMQGKAGRQRLHTIRASRPLRVLLACEGQTAVFLRAGPHEFIDKLVASVTFTVPHSGAPGLIAIRPNTADFDKSELTRVSARRADEATSERPILEPWSDRELADAEFDEEEISRLRRATKGYAAGRVAGHWRRDVRQGLEGRGTFPWYLAGRLARGRGHQARAVPRSDRTISRFEDAEIACQPLAKYEGLSTGAIKVGTFNRAKGLEFKVVFLLDLWIFPGRRRPAKAAAENDERMALHVSQLFVAMTRARDGLFLLCGDGPSEVISKAIEHFEDSAG